MAIVTNGRSRTSGLGAPLAIAGWLFADVLLALVIVFMAGDSPDPEDVPPSSVEDVVVTHPQDGAYMSGHRVLVRGVANSDQLIDVRVDGNVTCRAAPDESGHWSCLSSTVDDGPHVVNVGTPGAEGIHVTVDNARPDLTVRPPRSLSQGDPQRVQVNGTCSEDAGPVTVTIGRATGRGRCEGGVYRVSGLDVRSTILSGIQVSASQTDEAGNQGRVRRFTATPSAGIEQVPALLTISARNPEEVASQLRNWLGDFEGRRAGLVLAFGGGSDPGAGVALSGQVNRGLTIIDPSVFDGSVRRDFWDSAVPAGSVRLEVYFYA